MTTVSTKKTIDDDNNLTNIKELHLQPTEVSGIRTEIERLMPPPTYSNIEFLTPLPPPTIAETSTVIGANYVDSIESRSQSNLYNILHSSSRKVSELHSFLTGQNKDFTRCFTDISPAYNSNVNVTSSNQSSSVVSNWPLTSSAVTTTNLSNLINLKTIPVDITPKRNVIEGSSSAMAVAITEDSPLDKGIASFRKHQSGDKGLDNEDGQQVQMQDEVIVTDGDRFNEGSVEDSFVPLMPNSTSNESNTTTTQYGSKGQLSRSKGRSLLHRLASFAAAASNSTNFIPSNSPNRQLEKLAKRSFRLNSSGLKHTSLLMEILKLNSITEEEEQRDRNLQQNHEEQVNEERKNINFQDDNKTDNLSTAYQMLASQLLYTQFVQQASPLLILDYTSNKRNSQEREDCNKKTDSHGNDDNDNNSILLAENGNPELETRHIKTETDVKKQPASPTISVFTNSSTYNDPSDGNIAKLLHLWHEKLKVLTQAHICLEQFLEINQEMQQVFDFSIATEQQYVFNSLRDQKNLVEALIAKLHYVFRHCEDSRQSFIRSINQSEGESQQASPENNLKYLSEERLTPELKNDNQSKKIDNIEQNVMALKRETTDTYESIETPENKPRNMKNVWQPFVSETNQREDSVREDKGNKNQFANDAGIKSPICFWHPKNQGLNLNEKAVTAVEIILECAAVSKNDQDKTAKSDAQTMDLVNTCQPSPTSVLTSTLNVNNSAFMHTASTSAMISSSSSSTSSTPTSTNPLLSSHHTEEAPALNMLMADCGTSSFLTALSNRAFINLASSSSTITPNIPPITTTSPSINSNRRKTKKLDISSSPTSLNSMNATSPTFATSPPMTNAQIYGTHNSTAAAAVAALQEKALSDMFKVRFSALTAAAVINAATASANAAATVATTTTANNTNHLNNPTINTEGPYDLSIGSKFKKM